jgi:DNA polymerase kappa
MEEKRDLTHVWFHFDYDMFYAQAAIVENPVLRDMPFVVGAPVCTTASYVARQFGIRSGMPTHTAMKLYKHHVNERTRKTSKQAYQEGLRERFPDNEKKEAWEAARREELGGKCYDKAFDFKELMVTDCDFERYAEIAALGQEVYGKYDPNFLAPSSDEVYLNMTEYFKFDEREMTPEEKYKEMEDTMEKIRREVFEKAKLTVSGGGGPSMRLAKICSDVNKPNGQKILKFTSEDILSFLSTLSIRKIGGIGASMERYLNAFDVKTCGDIITHKAKLAKVCHATAYTFLFSVAMGIGMETVPPPIQDGAPGRRGVSMNRSWYPGISKYDSLFNILKVFAQGVSKEVKRLKFIPRQVMITMKFQHNFQQVTRQRDLPNASQNYEDWMATIKDLFDKLYDEFKGDSKPLDVRRLGVRVSKFKNEELENIKEDQRIKVLTVSDVNDLPPANMGVHRKDKTYECPMCGETISLEDRNDHEYAHELHTKWNKPKEGAHIPSSSSMRPKFAKKAPLQMKRNRMLNHHHRKSNSKLKPVEIQPDGSSKKTKRAIAPIDKQKNWRNKIPDRNQTRLK